MMIGWTVLKAKCKVCGKRADYRIWLTNDDLPDGYMKDGTRMEEYCEEHTPHKVFNQRDAMIKTAQTPP